MALGSLGKQVSNVLSETIKGMGDIGKATIEATRGNLVVGLRSARDVARESTGLMGDTIAGAIEAANKVGAELGTTAKGAVIGSIQAIGEVTTVTTWVISDTIRAAIKGT
ncbi:MAG: hypothetical protein JSV02_10325, partial [Dehalococcoidia bacterium]